MAHLICYSIIMGPIRFFLPGAHIMLKPALDIARISQEVEQAQKLLTSIETNTVYCILYYVLWTIVY